jgi:hypothetical protein
MKTWASVLLAFALLINVSVRIATPAIAQSAVQTPIYLSATSLSGCAWPSGTGIPTWTGTNVTAVCFLDISGSAGMALAVAGGSFTQVLPVSGGTYTGTSPIVVSGTVISCPTCVVAGQAVSATFNSATISGTLTPQ